MNKTIKYRVHISIILCIYVVQFFTPNFSLFLRNYQVTNDLNKLKATNSEHLFEKANYTPLTPATWDSGIPSEYNYVYVKKNGDITEEIFYTIGKRCDTTIFTYRGNVWQSTTHYDRWPILLFFFIPFSGFALFLFTTLHRWSRIIEKAGFSLFYFDLYSDVYVLGRGWHELPLDKVEKLSMLYGVPLFLSAIIFAFRHSI